LDDAALIDRRQHSILAGETTEVEILEAIEADALLAGDGGKAPMHFVDVVLGTEIDDWAALDASSKPRPPQYGGHRQLRSQ
jgi:hypothetical protein